MKADLRAAIEAELREYPVTVAQLSRLRELAFAPTAGERGGSKPTGITDPTWGVVKRLCSDEIMRMEYFVHAIESAYLALSPQLRQVVRLCYWQENPHYAVAEYMGMHPNTLRNLRDTVIDAIAFRMERSPARPIKRKARREAIRVRRDQLPYMPFLNASQRLSERSFSEAMVQ